MEGSIVGSQRGGEVESENTGRGTTGTGHRTCNLTHPHNSSLTQTIRLSRSPWVVARPSHTLLSGSTGNLIAYNYKALCFSRALFTPRVV